jgi:hypothetical protein
LNKEHHGFVGHSESEKEQAYQKMKSLFDSLLNKKEINQSSMPSKENPYQEVIDKVNKMDENESDGRRVIEYRALKEQMLAMPEKAKLAFEFQDFALKLSKDKDKRRAVEKYPLGSIEQFFYVNADNLEQFALTKVWTIMERMNEAKHTITTLGNSKKDADLKSYYEKEIVRDQQRIEDVAALYKQETGLELDYNRSGEKGKQEAGSSILNSEVDLKGDEKERFMYIPEFVVKKQAGDVVTFINASGEQQTGVFKGWYEGKKEGKAIIEKTERNGKKNFNVTHVVDADKVTFPTTLKGMEDVQYFNAIEHALANGLFEKAIMQGRMSASDAKTIIEKAGFKVPSDIADRHKAISNQKPIETSLDKVEASLYAQSLDPVKVRTALEFYEPTKEVIAAVGQPRFHKSKVHCDVTFDFKGKINSYDIKVQQAKDSFHIYSGSYSDSNDGQHNQWRQFDQEFAEDAYHIDELILKLYHQIQEHEKGVKDLMAKYSKGEAKEDDQYADVIEKIKKLDEYEASGYRVTNLRELKESMLKNPARAKRAFEFQRFALKLWKDQQIQRRAEIHPLSSVEQFYHSDAQNLEQFALSLIKGHQVSIASHERMIGTLGKTKKDQRIKESYQGSIESENKQIQDTIALYKSETGKDLDYVEKQPKTFEEYIMHAMQGFRKGFVLKMPWTASDKDADWVLATSVEQVIQFMGDYDRENAVVYYVDRDLKYDDNVIISFEDGTEQMKKMVEALVPKVKEEEEPVVNGKHEKGDEAMYHGGEVKIKDVADGNYFIVNLDEDGKEKGKERKVSIAEFDQAAAKFPKSEKKEKPKEDSKKEKERQALIERLRNTTTFNKQGKKQPKRNERAINQDLNKKALPPGKRKSAKGNTYYEDRPDHSDKDPKEQY